MAGEGTTNIREEYNVARTGLNLDSSVNQVEKGKLTYALNAAVENFDSNSVNYQNEPGNELCLQFPANFHLIGEHFIAEQNKHVFFLVNPETGDSQIGYMDNNDCVYRVYVNSPCLNFNINYPIHKAVHKITNCTTEIYWTDGLNPRRYLDLNNIPYTTQIGDTICDVTTLTTIDCNKLKIQPNFDIPYLEIADVVTGGELRAGTYQFAIQYGTANGDAYTSYYSITNPTPIFNVDVTTLDFNYPVTRSIVLNISNLDLTGYFQYYNIAVIKTINNITSVELVGTYFIDGATKQITYTGQNQTQIVLSINDIFEKYPYYDIAQDLTSVQDILVWDNLTSIDQINYQKIANQIQLQWQTYRIPSTENYADPINATDYRGYMRDEIYPFEIVFLLKNGKQTDGFHIPGRAISYNEVTQPDISSDNPDFVGTPDYTSGGLGWSKYWKIYNTASITGFAPEYSTDASYKGPCQYGEFAYWESTDTYPCNTEVWGDLAGQPIRHHKFPDVLVSPIFESPTFVLVPGFTPVMQNDAVFPIGVRLNIQQVSQLIYTSNLTDQQKADIVGFKIVRGNRSTNRSIVAKGILRNVGKYDREGTEYYFPNYPYNDLSQDPFLLENNNAYNSQCSTYTIVVGVVGDVQYTNCETAQLDTITYSSVGTYTLCSMTDPVGITATITPTNTTARNSAGINTFCYPGQLNAFSTDASKYRQVFNSPETSFGAPFLGSIMKIENVIFGGGRAHFVEVKKHATYKLITEQAQIDALNSSYNIANITTFDAVAMFTAYQAYLQIYINGISRKNYAYSFNSIASYDYCTSVPNNQGVKQRELDICQYLIPGAQSVGDNAPINNYNRESSVYIKTVDTRDGVSIPALPYPDKSPEIAPVGVSLFSDDSRFTLSERSNCSFPEKQEAINVIAYYGSLKNYFANQWGQIYSYQTIDTGFQANIEPNNIISGQPSIATVFGGDTFISKFAFKTKLPFFIDNRVNAPDDSDIFYDEIGNVAYPQYWYSARSVLSNYTLPNGTVLKNIISVKAHNFDCPGSQVFPLPTNTTTSTTSTSTTSTSTTISPYATINTVGGSYEGKMYLFAYGIPYFYVESTINVDLRQAYNNAEGDFYPHVSTGIPDNWLQESAVPIAFDNTYYYNPTFSKQNTENFFSHLPVDWRDDQCFTNYPFRAIYSEAQDQNPNVRVNSWLVYRPLAYFDFPQNYGDLISLDGIQNKAVLARFENKSLLYNTMLTVQTSNPQAAYLGYTELFRSAPPIDFAETDLGYVGTQNKMLLKIPQGQITIDAKRGQVFLIAGNQAVDLSAFGSGLNRFFTDHLAFEILRYYPNVDTDNHFNGIGLHGVFDSKFDRVIISKLDYIPQLEYKNVIKYDEVTKEFYIDKMYGEIEVREVIKPTDSKYFCNKSWTLSFNMNTRSWVSFHSYIPNFYIAENNFFYSGLNEGCDLEAIAIQEIPTPSTTTTTTTLIECEIEGVAECVDCTTTTTTSSTTTTTTTTTAYVCAECNNWEYNGATIPAEGDVINYYSCETGLAQTIVLSNGDPTGQFCNCDSVGLPTSGGTVLTQIGSCVTTTTTTTTAPPEPITCTSFQIINNGVIAISWIGISCLSGLPVGGTVNGGSSTNTGCLQDGSFAYGDNGNLEINPELC